MKRLSRLFSRNPGAETEQEIASLIDGFASGTGEKWDWDYFISTKFESERVTWAQKECLKVEQEFPRMRLTDWCNEEGLERLREIASQLRTSAKRINA